ncbi:type II secretion system F family protein [Candidatus Micrarchaeota archaeon]|nr:type II secretion system F family protein [Candidatus Micrarchaeota archaeon]
MKSERIPFLLLPEQSVMRLSRRFRVGQLLLPLFPSLRGTLQKTRIEFEAGAYIAASIISSFIYGILFFIISIIAQSLRAGGAQGSPLLLPLGVGIVMWGLFLALHLYYPTIVMRKVAAKENKDLLFALREIIIDIDGGVPLFDSMKNVSLAGYGYVSADFDRVVRQIESGMPEREALKQLALKTESEYLKRAAWQMVNALESGAKMSDALEGIAVAVENYLFREIKNYTTSLNFLLLIYMLGGVVAPSLGITFMILLSAFSGLGVTIDSVILMIIGASAIQLVLIGYMASTRPGLFGG